jgi:hypothetical protein
MPPKGKLAVPERPTEHRRGQGTWQIRWWALMAIAGVLGAAAIPSIVRSIQDHRGSRPAASADHEREIVIYLSWSPGNDSLYPNPPNASLAYRTVNTAPGFELDLADWPLPDPFFPAGLGSEDLRADPGTPLAVTGTVDRVQVYFVTSVHGTGKPVARVDLRDGVGRLPDLHGTYTMVILGRWQPGTVGFTETVHLGP